MSTIFKTIEPEESGKIIYERHPEWKFNKEQRLYEKVISDDFVVLESYTEYKYLINDTDIPGCYKMAEQDYLYEGLVTTFPIEMFIARLQEYEDAGFIKILQTENPLNALSVKPKTPLIEFAMDKYLYDNKDDDEIGKYYDSLMSTLNVCGYFVAHKSIIERMDPIEHVPIKFVVFEVHPKFIIEVTPSVYNQLNGILYHITTKNNLKRIEENGLIPRNGNFYADEYPDRVYFFTNLPPDKFERRCEEFAKTRKEKKREILTKAVEDYNSEKISKSKLNSILNTRYDYRDWVVLKIDLKDEKVYKEYTRATSYKFFDDPKTPAGIFTYENIDPYFIKLPPIAEFHIQDTNDFENMI